MIHCCLSSNSTVLGLCASYAQISGSAPTFSTAVFGLDLECQPAPPQLLGQAGSGWGTGRDAHTSEPFQPGARARITDRVEEPQRGLFQLSTPMMDEDYIIERPRGPGACSASGGLPGLVSWGLQAEPPPFTAGGLSEGTSQ